jgi:hypothetical protein
MYCAVLHKRLPSRSTILARKSVDLTHPTSPYPTWIISTPLQRTLAPARVIGRGFISDDPYNAPTGNGHTGLFRALGVPAQNPTYRRAAPLSFRWLFSSFLVSARRRAPRSSASPDGGSGTYLKHQVIWNTS